MDLYKQADILFLHLDSSSPFKKVLPSKIFEYAATGKPILAGVSGYAAEFIKDNLEGAEIFDPVNVDEMKKSLRKLIAGPAHFERKHFCMQYSRKLIMEKLSNDILNLPKKLSLNSTLKTQID